MGKSPSEQPGEGGWPLSTWVLITHAPVTLTLRGTGNKLQSMFGWILSKSVVSHLDDVVVAIAEKGSAGHHRAGIIIGITRT